MNDGTWDMGVMGDVDIEVGYIPMETNAGYAAGYDPMVPPVRNHIIWYDPLKIRPTEGNSQSKPPPPHVSPLHLSAAGSSRVVESKLVDEDFWCRLSPGPVSR